MSKRLITAEDLLKMTFVGDVQASPCGRLVLFSARTITEKYKQVAQLWTAEIESGALKQWTQGSTSASQGRFSPNGEFLSFIAKREGPSAQIHLLPLSGGEAKALTQFPEGDLGWHLWSPDGRWILVSYRERHPNWTESAKKAREEKGESTPPWELENLWWRLDGDGVFGSARFHLYLVDAQDGSHRLLFNEDQMGFTSAAWMPDSKGLVLAYNPDPQPWISPKGSEIFTLSLKGKLKKVKTGLKGSKFSPRVSPDGQHVAFLGDSHPGAWGAASTRVYVAPLQGGEARCLTSDLDEDFDVLTLSDTNAGHTADGGGSGFLEWAPDGKKLISAIGRRGAVHIVSLLVEDGSVEWLTSGPRCCVPSSLSKDGTWVAGVAGDATSLNEAAVFPLTGDPYTLTRFNHWVNKEISLSDPEEFEVDSTDGAKVHAWVMMPPGDKGKKKLPAVLQIHGGPHGQYGWAFFHEFQLLAAQGYAVVFSNPRGSKGYGEAWCKAIEGNWGDKDWDDIKAVSEWMAHNPRFDHKKLGVMGGSYGGWMTNWVIGHTDIFCGAITDRCVSNMVSFAGNSDFVANRGEYFGGVAFGSLERIAPLWRQSPLAYFENVKTPTLIIHSEGDFRCNIEQSEQVFSALQQRGVESRFVRYPLNTSHGLSRGGPPDLRLHRLGEIVSWWKKRLG